MIRVLLENYEYHKDRIELFERMWPLQRKKLSHVKRAWPDREKDVAIFLEGFLESEAVLQTAAIRLTDTPLFIEQLQFKDMRTWVIEDGRDIPF